MEQPKLENIKAAYEAADESGKKMLRALYPDVFTQPKRAESNRPVTERVKTFDDACHELGEAHPLVQHLNLFEHHLADHLDGMDDVLAYLKMRIVVAALNEGWTPDWGNKDEYKWYPWFYILTEEEYNDLDDDAKCRVVGRAGYSAQAYGGLVCLCVLRFFALARELRCASRLQVQRACCLRRSAVRRIVGFFPHRLKSSSQGRRLRPPAFS